VISEITRDLIGQFGDAGLDGIGGDQDTSQVRV
jgi:hypothetical protein